MARAGFGTGAALPAVGEEAQRRGDDVKQSTPGQICQEQQAEQHVEIEERDVGVQVGEERGHGHERARQRIGDDSGLRRHVTALADGDVLLSAGGEERRLGLNGAIGEDHAELLSPIRAQGFELGTGDSA